MLPLVIIGWVVCAFVVNSLTFDKEAFNVGQEFDLSTHACVALGTTNAVFAPLIIALIILAALGFGLLELSKFTYKVILGFGEAYRKLRGGPGREPKPDLPKARVHDP